MNIVEEIFKFYSANFEKLIGFGFKKVGKDFVYETEMLGGQFLLKVKINTTGEISTKVVDKQLDEEYVLHLMDTTGEFVGKVRGEFEEILTKIRELCFEREVFKSKNAKLIIEYVRTKYGDELEFLWDSSPNTAILRRKDNRKWYAVLFVLPKSKLGLKTDEVSDVIDLRIEPDELTKLVDNKTYFPGYHMNKKHWLTFCLDTLFTPQQLYSFIDNSYTLAKK